MSLEHTRKKNIKSSALQPSITSFFGKGSNTNNATATVTTTREIGQLASVPPSVQSRLVQVGMRVRKSVQDGYKTKSSQKLDFGGAEKENSFAGATSGYTPITSSKNKRGAEDDESDDGGMDLDMKEPAALGERKFAQMRPSRLTHQAVLRKSESDIASKTGIITEEDFGEAPFLQFGEDEMTMEG